LEVEWVVEEALVDVLEREVMEMEESQVK